MGLLGNLWGRDYSEVLETVLVDPKSGEPLFVAIHAGGRGADVLTESNLPEVSDVGDYASFAASARAGVVDAMENMGGNISIFSAQFGQKSAAVTEIMNSGRVNIINPGVEDVPIFAEALEIISKEASRLNIENNHGDEHAAVMGEIANDAWALREDIQKVFDSTGFSVVNSVTAQLTAMGISPAEINAAMSVDPVVNTHQFNPASPQVP